MDPSEKIPLTAGEPPEIGGLAITDSDQQHTKSWNKIVTLEGTN
jgi:hypothetical protein